LIVGPGPSIAALPASSGLEMQILTGPTRPTRETNTEHVDEMDLATGSEAKRESRNTLIVLRKQAETACLEGHKSRLT